MLHEKYTTHFNDNVLIMKNKAFSSVPFKPLKTIVDSRAKIATLNNCCSHAMQNTNKDYKKLMSIDYD